MSHPTESSLLDEVLTLIATLARLASQGRFIFRGEAKASNRQIASSLYRHIDSQYPRVLFDAMDLSQIQREMLGTARQFTSEVDDHQILATLRHNGGPVNFVDFTTDYNIALFFACDGSDADNREDGRLIVLNKDRLETFTPKVPTNRVLAQKSIFVVPSEGRGVISRSEVERILTIPARLKPVFLKYLRDSHDIRLETIYNDLLGFIGLTQQDRFISPFAELTTSSMAAARGDFNRALDGLDALMDVPPYDILARFERGKIHNEMGSYSKAVDDLSAFISASNNLPTSHLAVAYMERGRGFLHLGKIKLATEDLQHAKQLFSETSEGLEKVAGVSLAMVLLAQSKWKEARTLLQDALDAGYLEGFGFCDDFGSVSDFNQKYGVKIPNDLVDMLEPPQETPPLDSENK